MLVFMTIILLVFVFDFAKLRKQNDRLIDQNDKIISLLEDIKEGKKG